MGRFQVLNKQRNMYSDNCNIYTYISMTQMSHLTDENSSKVLVWHTLFSTCRAYGGRWISCLASRTLLLDWTMAIGSPKL